MTIKVIVVFARQSIETMIRKGGTGSWKLKGHRARRRSFVVCTRNAEHPDVEGPEAHRSAFLIAKIRDIVPSPTMDGRFMVQFSEFARVDIPDVWRKGVRNPVRYTTFEELGIDPSILKWEPMPVVAVNEPSEPRSTKADPSEGLTIADAKKALARTFGVPPEAIEITVRG